MKVINLDTPTLGDRSYIAHDSKFAVVVDPQRDIDRVIEIVESEGVQIVAVVETHMHNDYVSGGLVLAREFGAKYLVNEADPVAFDRNAIKDLEVVEFGDFAIQAIHTPGHTYTHLSYALLDNSEKALGIFTGGSMLHGSTGRPDLLGQAHANELAGLQYKSAHRLADMFEGEVRIHPTHGFGSFCAATATSGDSSTIADEKIANPVLLLSQNEYVEQTLAGLDAFPSYYKHMGPANHAGPGPVDIGNLARLTGEELVKHINAGVWIVDLRNRNEYVNSHLAKTLNFGLDGSMATYFGWMFDYEQNVILSAPTDAMVTEAHRELVRIGIDKPLGAFVGDITAVDPQVSMKQVLFKDVVQGLKDENVVVLDVRRSGERVASHIKGTLHIPLHELESRVEELPTDKDIWIHCAGAYRASASLGIVERSGRKAVLINEAFDAAHSVAELEFVEGAADHAPVAPSDLTLEKS